MDLTKIKDNFKLGFMKIEDMKLLIDTVEKQQKELNEAHCRELSYIDDIEQLEGMLSQANERIKEIEKKTRFVDYEKMFKENTALAQELALIKGEISG